MSLSAAAAALVASVGLGFVKGWGTRERERCHFNWAGLLTRQAQPRHHADLARNRAGFGSGVFCTVWLVRRCGLSGFVIQGLKSNNRNSSELKNGLFPIF